MNAVFDSYAPYAGPINQLRKNGVLVSTEGGNSTNYALDNLGTIYTIHAQYTRHIRFKWFIR